MAGKNSIDWSILFIPLLFSSTLLLSLARSSLDGRRKDYIVYMGDKPKSDISAGSSLHINMLEEILGSEASSCLLCSYKKSFNGFAVKLTEEEKARVARLDGVVSVFPSEKKILDTTRSWDFMGFSQQVERATLESDIIIGVLDTGIWPESESFSDKGFGPPPRKWKGTCETSNVTCNNKIIGARHYRSDGLYLPGDIRSARDSDGHGTHVASTAAGGLVSMASLMGFGSGTARGGVPSARIAVYKICWLDECSDADILAAFDDAIDDGVDIISISVGGPLYPSYFMDSIAIGSFHAMKNGILTSTSAGNSGPYLGSTSKVSPWFLSVAASTIDRKFKTKLHLGNDMVYEGVSINTFDMKNGMYPVVYGGAVPNRTEDYSNVTSRFCFPHSLNSTLVKGRILLCDTDNDGQAAVLNGAVGMVMRDAEPKDFAQIYPLPASYLGLDDGEKIADYINSTRNPTATILKSNEVNDPLAPYIVSFSSRGPNRLAKDILSPDVAAPGVDILAAYSPISPISGVQSDQRRAPFSIISGTSMACPHASAVAAYVKSFHSSWSPAMIKSALMTTAYPLSALTSPDAEFAYGAGHIDPVKAVDPGLVYEAGISDYIKFLCGQGYNTTELRLVTGDATTCTKSGTNAAWDLNLPTFTLSTTPLQTFSRNFTRTVTNVGSPVSMYKAKVTSIKGISIRVEPDVLSFTSLDQRLSYVVKVEGAIGSTRVSGSLVWDDGRHQVRSPIVVYALDLEIIG